MGKRRPDKAKKDVPAEEDKGSDNEQDDCKKKEDEGFTAQNIGIRIRWISTYLLDYRLGLMCLGLAMGSIFSEWLNTVIAPAQR